MVAALAIFAALLAVGWLVTVLWRAGKVHSADASVRAAETAAATFRQERDAARDERDALRGLVAAKDGEIASLRAALAKRESVADRADRMGASDGL